MATLLRSLKYVRRLNLQGRRLCSSSPSCSSATLVTSERLLQLSRTQCALLHGDRTYVTRPAFKSKFYAANNIDSMLNELDQKVRSYQMIYKSNIDHVLNVVTEKGSLTSTQALLLIRCCGEFLCGESLQVRNSLTDQIWETIKELGVPVDVSHYNALLLVYLENERDFSPVDILLEMKTNNIEPNRVTFQRLIQQYCNKGDIAGATKILEHMSEKEIPINETIFNSLIKGHSEAGDIPSAVKILDIMKNAGIEPTSRTYSEILCAYAKKGDVDSIRLTFNECREKNIQLADKEILDIIYTLAVNQHLDTIDEMITYLTKGGLYNKDAVACILKLIEKDCVDTAYKLLKTMVKPENRENFESGGFFLRKLVVSGASPETIIKYCNLLKEEKLHNNPFELAIIHMFSHDKQHLALPVMKYWAELGGEIREHYFYPIFVAHSKDNNLQGLLNTVKTMVFDFKITPSITSIKEYIVPFLVDDAFTNVQTLANNHLPFSNAAHAMLLHLLNQSRAQQAYSFICSTNMTYRLAMLPRTLARALVDTKDVDSIAGIVHHQYVLSQKNQNQTTAEDRLSPREFSGSVVAAAVNRLPAYDTKLISEFLKKLHQKGVGINEEAAERIKAQLGNNITAEIEGLLNTLLSEDLELQDIERSGNYQNEKFDREFKAPVEGTPEFKMLLIQQHARSGENETVEKLLSQLDQESITYTAGFCATMVDYFSKAEDINEATKWFNKLRELNPDFKLDKAKLLNYAIAFVKNNQIDEALQVLKYPINDEDTNRNTLSEKLLDRVVDICPDRVEEFFKLLEAQKFVLTVTNSLLGPIVKAPLKAGNIEAAVEKYKWACENYKLTPCKILLMSRLIKNEDAKTLKYVTDLSTQVYGEINSLIDLAVAFFECERPHQARKILETPGLRLNRERMKRIVDKYYNYDDTRLEGFIQLLNGLFLDMDSFYVLLLKSYGKRNEWEKSLALWTQLQEDNIQPSTNFMEELERILRQCNQKIPFASSSKIKPINLEFDSGLLEQNPEQAENMLNELPIDDERGQNRLKVVEGYLTLNNLDKAVSHLLTALDENPEMVRSCSELIQNIIEKLVESDQFELITELVTKLRMKFSRKNSAKKNSMSYHKFVNECYLKQGKYNEFLSHLDKLLDDSNSNSLSINIFHGTFNTSVLLQHPEFLENMKKLALKALKRDNYFPINSVWTYYFIKDDPEAEVIYNEHIKNTKYFYAISAMYACKDAGAWDKLPKLAEKIITSPMKLQEQRNCLFQILNAIMASEEPKKYEIAYECLRHIVKIVPIDNIKEEHLSKLKANLPNELSIESIKSDNDRVKEEATG